MSNELKEFQATPELNSFFQKLYELKLYVKSILDKENGENFLEIQKIYNDLDKIFLPNNKKMDGQE